MIRLTQIDENQSIYRDKKVILWGAGITGKIMMELLESFDIEIYAFCDNNEKLWGTKAHGKNIISPKQVQDVAQSEEPYIIQMAVGFAPSAAIGFFGEEALAEQLLQIGLEKFITGTEAYRMLRYLRFLSYAEKNNSIIHSSGNRYDFMARDVAQVFYAVAEKMLNYGSEENNILVCMPLKSGDHTLNNTFSINGVKYLNNYHRSGYFKKYVDKEFYQEYSKTIKVITAVREPIGQNISAVYQLVSFCGATIPLMEHATLSFLSDYDEETIKNLKTSIYKNGGDAQMFFDIFIHAHANAREFIALEDTIQNFIPSFQQNMIDFLAHPFDKEKGYSVIKEGDIECFVFQLEKLNNLVPELSQWVGVPFGKLEVSNVGTDKWIGKSYKQAQKELRFSKEYFESCFDQPYVKHCYTEADIEKFKNKWRGNIR